MVETFSLLPSFHTLAECRVLNYSSTVCTEALLDLKDRENAARMGHAANVPVGLSQTSHFADGNDEDDTFSFIVNEPDKVSNDGHCSARLKSIFTMPRKQFIILARTKSWRKKCAIF